MLADLLPQLLATTMEKVEEQACGKCGDWKTLDQFSVDQKRRRQRWCKDCQNTYYKDWRRK